MSLISLQKPFFIDNTRSVIVALVAIKKKFAAAQSEHECEEINWRDK